MSDLIAKKKARLEALKKAAADKKAKRDKKINKSDVPTGQGGGSEDIDQLIDKAINSTPSAFDERRKKEEEEENPSDQTQMVNSNLTVALDQCEYSIPPVSIEQLEQEIQCEVGPETLDAKEESKQAEAKEETITEVPAEKIRRKTITKTNVDGMPMVTEMPGDGAAKDAQKDKEKPEENVKPILDKEEAEAVAGSQEFKNFFTRASRLVERGLFSDIDVIGSFERLEVEEGDAKVTKDQKIFEKCGFMTENPIKRAITNLEWSPKHKELFLASYYSSENDWNANETDGLVNIFSTQMPSTPELTLTCQSQITSCIFHETEPFLVVGGTFSGNVIVWDMREKRNYPIVKTPTASSVMIKGISVVGTQNANNIVTVSNDGSICVWSLNMMKEPSKKVDLMTKNNELSVHCIDFPEGETNQFYIGSEDSNIYDVKIHTKKQNDENIGDVLSGHNSCVFSLHHHPTIHQKKSEASGLLLSTAADWSLGLWHPKTRREPLLMHEGEVEYYDAQWSPVCPSVFAACNGSGQLELWDIAKETEECRYRLDADKRAINKLRWSQDGKRLLTGNSNGAIKLYNVDKEFTNYREDDLTKLERMLMPSKRA